MPLRRPTFPKRQCPQMWPRCSCTWCMVQSMHRQAPTLCTTCLLDHIHTHARAADAKCTCKQSALNPAHYAVTAYRQE